MRHRRFFFTILIVAGAGVSGCGDEVTDPDAFLESAQAEAVMRSAREVPMLPDLMDRVDPASSRDRAVLVRAQELWAAGTMNDARSGSRRRLAVSYALPVLVASLPADDWTAARDGMVAWIGTVESMLQHLAVPGVLDHTEAAEHYLARSDAARDDARRRAYYVLLAMSELVETTPAYVARSLVREAGTALDRVPPADEDSRVVARAARLKDWAEQAVAEGDYLLAIQRAYYAIQLVEEP